MPEQKIESAEQSGATGLVNSFDDESSPQNPEPLLVSDELLVQAEQVCLRRVESAPDNPAVLRSLAQVYRKLGKLDQALSLFERVCQLDPSDLEAVYLREILAGRHSPILSERIRPAPFVLIRNFLPEEFHKTLYPFALTIRDQLIPATVAGKAGTEYKPNTRESLHHSGRGDYRQRFGRIIREVIPQVAARLHVPPFEIDDAEVKMRVYLDGHFFRLHMDCPASDPTICNRKISYVYFFHKEPRGFLGGELLIFDTKVEDDTFTTKSFTRVIPQDNSVIIFPSAYWHSVIPVKCPSKEYADSRFVINGHITARVATTTTNTGDTA